MIRATAAGESLRDTSYNNAHASRASEKANICGSKVNSRRTKFESVVHSQLPTVAVSI